MPQMTTVQVTIANNTAVSSTSANVFPFTIVGIQMPAAWTPAGITFCKNADGSGPVLDQYGTEVQLTVAQGEYHPIAPVTLFGVSQVYVRSGTNSSPVNQGADRVITLTLWAL